MPDEQPSEFTAKIVAAYVRRNQVQPDQLAVLISTVHQALARLGEPPTEPVVERTPAVSIRRSVHRDYVVCLDCGWRGQMLRRHVTTAHGLTVEEYRARWNLAGRSRDDGAQAIPSADQRWRSRLGWVVVVGHRSKRRNRRHPKPRRRHPGGEDDHESREADRSRHRLTHHDRGGSG